MADLLGTVGVGKIVELAWSIKQAVETVRHNKEECHKIEAEVCRVSAILSQLEEKVPETMKNPVTSGALKFLAEELDTALKLVKDCQESRFRRILAPGGLAEKLRRARDDISKGTMIALFAIDVHDTIIINKLLVVEKPWEFEEEARNMECIQEEEEDAVGELMVAKNEKLLKAADDEDHGSSLFLDPTKGTVVDATLVGCHTRRQRGQRASEARDFRRLDAMQVPKEGYTWEVTEPVTTVENGSHSTSIHEIFGSSETVTIEGEEAGLKLTASIAESKNISPNWSGPLDISSGSTNTTEVHETEAKKDENDTKGKVIIEEYDLEKILDEQETHDLYCPKCHTCITRRVILRKRKRTARTARCDEAPKRQQFEQPWANVSNQDPAQSLDPQSPEVFRCFSCFTFFIGTDSLKKPLLSGSQSDNDKAGSDFLDRRNKEEIKQEFSEFHVTASSSVAVHTSSSSSSRSEADFKRFSLSELEDATHNFLEDNIIGRGAFATVYKGFLHDGPVVAIKKIQCSYKLSKHICDILSHVSKLEHKNIVRLLGHGHRVVERAVGSQDEKDRGDKVNLFLIEEYMPNGSLERIIYESQIDWSSRLSLIQRIAHGLHYLHEQQIIHLDLKPNNILIDYDMNPKITDFGRARMLDQGDDVTTLDTNYLLAGTMGYMPPEYIMEGVVSKMYDVYSFGVTLLETISGMCRSKPAHRQASIEWAWAAREAGRMEELLDLSLCSETQLNEARRCLEIGLLCTQSDRADRPTMVDVVEMLDSKKELPTPKQPKYTNRRSA